MFPFSGVAGVQGGAREGVFISGVVFCDVFFGFVSVSAVSLSGYVLSVKGLKFSGRFVVVLCFADVRPVVLYFTFGSLTFLVYSSCGFGPTLQLSCDTSFSCSVARFGDYSCFSI